MPKRPNEREYRTMPGLEIRKEEAEGGAYDVEGYATTFEQPYKLFEIENKPYFEIVDRAALDGADMSDVILQFDHQGTPMARKSNGTLTLSIDDHGLRVHADLSKTEKARGLYEDISAGMIREMSFAFTIGEEEFDEETRTWRIKRIKKVFDVSAVSIPANPGTDISAARQRCLDGVIEAQRAERLAAEKRQRQKDIIRIKLKLMDL